MSFESSESKVIVEGVGNEVITVVSSAVLVVVITAVLWSIYHRFFPRITSAIHPDNVVMVQVSRRILLERRRQRQLAHEQGQSNNEGTPGTLGLQSQTLQEESQVPREQSETNSREQSQPAREQSQQNSQEHSHELLGSVSERSRPPPFAPMQAPSAPAAGDEDRQCPICLAPSARLAIETNCGHLFCGECMLAYWQHGSWIGAVKCPACRQSVVLMLPSYTDDEMNMADTEEMRARDELLAEIRSYNRRFSGEPRTVSEIISDVPILLRHLWAEFFSMTGLMWMFRLRILLCVGCAIIYLVSPLDVIPESVFGFFGFLDDVFVLLLLAIYLSILYRNFVADR